jgi:hypothetical protein
MRDFFVVNLFNSCLDQREQHFYGEKKNRLREKDKEGRRKQDNEERE